MFELTLYLYAINLFYYWICFIPNFFLPILKYLDIGSNTIVFWSNLFKSHALNINIWKYFDTTRSMAPRFTGWGVSREGYHLPQPTATCYVLIRGEYNHYTELGQCPPPPVKAVWYDYTPGDIDSRISQHWNVQEGFRAKAP